MSDKNMSGKDFFIGAVVGGLLGAVTALLLAPKSGQELRGDISHQVHQVSDKTKQIASDVSDKTQQLAREFSTRSSEIAEKAKEIGTKIAEELLVWNEARKQAAITNNESNVAETTPAVVEPEQSEQTTPSEETNSSDEEKV